MDLLQRLGNVVPAEEDDEDAVVAAVVETAEAAGVDSSSPRDPATRQTSGEPPPR